MVYIGVACHQWMMPRFGHSIHPDPIVPYCAYFDWSAHLTSAFIYCLAPYSTGAVWIPMLAALARRYNNHSFLRQRPCLECKRQRREQSRAGHSVIVSAEWWVSPISSYFFCCNLLWMPLTIDPLSMLHCVQHYWVVRDRMSYLRVLLREVGAHDNIYAYYLKTKCLINADREANVQTIDKVFEIQEKYSGLLTKLWLQEEAGISDGIPLLSCKLMYQLELYNGDAYMALKRWDDAHQNYRSVWDEATKDNQQMQYHAALHMSRAAYESGNYDTTILIGNNVIQACR